MAQYGVVHTTNIKNPELYSFQSTVEIENGSLVHKGDLIAGERSVYEAVQPTATSTETDSVYLVAHPAWPYDDSFRVKQNEDAYINPADEAFRVYALHSGDRFKLTAYSFVNPTAVAVGSYVYPTAGSYKMSIDTAAPTTAFVGKIIGVDETGFAYAVGSAGTIDTSFKMVLIEVVSN